MHRRTRLAALVPTLLLALVVVAQPAAAISESSTSGLVGTWIANDALTTPGAQCNYNASSHLVKLSARPPVVFARRAGGQTVGWKLKVVRNYELPNNPGQYADQVVYQSAFQKLHATLSTPASFSRKAWTVSGATSQSTRYKVWVVIKWYTPSGASEGSVTYRYDWFKEILPTTGKTDQIYFCYKSYF